jgi:hypothetical protein
MKIKRRRSKCSLTLCWHSKISRRTKKTTRRMMRMMMINLSGQTMTSMSLKRPESRGGRGEKKKGK